jgi:hypothetical protein
VKAQLVAFVSTQVVAKSPSHQPFLHPKTFRTAFRSLALAVTSSPLAILLDACACHIGLTVYEASLKAYLDDGHFGMLGRSHMPRQARRCTYR